MARQRAAFVSFQPSDPARHRHRRLLLAALAAAAAALVLTTTTMAGVVQAFTLGRPPSPLLVARRGSGGGSSSSLLWWWRASAGAGPVRRPWPHTHQRRRGLAQAIETGEWVVVKETGLRAQIVSKQSNGWWRLQEEGDEGRIISARTGSLIELSEAGGAANDGQAGSRSSRKDGGGGAAASASASGTGSKDGLDDLPRPQVLDLANYPLHAAAREWVVFSDLHCSVQTLPTCREVLARVHAEAASRGAGIIFLGDFWHIRGAIRVEVLNAVMRDLGTWTQPVVMIPGNHDQVTLDGTVHALTPLGFAVGSARGAASGAGGPALSQAVVITRPSVFMDALWLPYARDPSLTRALLAPYRLQVEDDDAAAALDGVRAVFCHVDVRGAAMNDNTRSRRGLQPSAFPASLPTYTGHFHKPHRVPCRSPVTYVGSPYQVSLAEAGQQKRLLVLRRDGGGGGGVGNGWEEVGSVHLDIGRRYFRPPSVAAARALLGDGQLRKGDWVVLSLHESTAPEVEELRGDLRAQAEAELEVREVPPEEGGPLLQNLLELEEGGAAGGKPGAPAPPTTMDYETLGTAAVWRAYMNETAAAEADAEVVEEEGLRLIEAWEAGAGGATTNATIASSLPGAAHGAMVRLELDRLRLEGYGPFREPVEYPLGGRGLVLLRGKNLDDPGAESNAAGKSKLAMAGLWALTGEGDERPVMDAKVTDVAFDVTGKAKSSFAEVSLSGRVNGVPFEVTRRRGARVNQLSFALDGEDRSRQSARETQKAMEEALGLDMDFLGLAIFCGQHQMSGLLEATDVRLKERLSKIVRLDVWEELKEEAKARLKHRQEQAAAADTQVRVQELDLERQLREEAEFLEAVERETASLAAGRQQQQPAAAAGAAAARSLEQVEAELAAAGEKLEAARGAWKAALERREAAAKSRAAAGESAGARRERLRALKAGFEEDARAAALLEDRWDPELYWADLQRFGSVPKDARPAVAELGLAFAAHVPKEAWAAKVQTVELARAKCLADAGAAATELRKVEAALASLTGQGDVAGGAGTSPEDAAAAAAGCPTCGRPWEEGVGAEKAVAHLKAEIARAQARLKEAEERRPRVEAQRNAVARIAEAHAVYLRDVEDWQVLRQRLEGRRREIADLDKAIAAEAAAAAAAEGKEDGGGAAAGEEDLAKREKEYRECQLAYDKLQDERPRLVQLQAEMEARARAATEAQRRLDRKRTELDKLREVLEQTKAVRAEHEAKAKLHRELVERFGMRGAQAFVLRGAVAQLERLSNRFLGLLSEGGLRLGLALEGEKITKEVKVRGADGVFHDRTLAQLSGGQWRRASLATMMAFRELSRLRSRVDCNVLVLDEVLNHLDGPGRARVGRMLRAMCQRPVRRDGPLPTDAAAAAATAAADQGGGGGEYGGISTAIVILQDLIAYELEDSFDFVDEVVKEGDVSRVLVDDRAPEAYLFDDDDEDDSNADSGLLLRDPAAETAAGAGKEPLLASEPEEELPVVQAPPSPPLFAQEEEEEEDEEDEDEEDEEPAPVVTSRVVKGGWLDGLEEAIL